MCKVLLLIGYFEVVRDDDTPFPEIFVIRNSFDDTGISL